MSEDSARVVTQICISWALLLAGLGILTLGVGDSATQKLAAGWVGAVLGFWLQ
jgi:hypothetical protein